MSQRMLRVQELFKRELSTIFQRDYNVDGILLTINEVEITPDLREGTVYLGIIGDKIKADRMMRRLNTDHGTLQKKVAKRVTLRYTPVLKFVRDDSIERGVHILSVIQELDNLPTAADSVDQASDEAE